MQVGTHRALRWALILAGLLVARDAAAFQGDATISKEDFAALRQNASNQTVHHGILRPALKKLKERVNDAIRHANVGKVEAAATSSSVLLDFDYCDVEVTALDVHATIASTTHREPEKEGVASDLQNGLHIEFFPFIMESQMNITGAVKVRYGTVVFNTCQKWFNADPIPLEVRTSGFMEAKLGLDLVEPKLEGPDGSPRLVFDLHHTFLGKVERWNVNKVSTQGKACEFQLAGQWDANWCDRVEDVMKRGDRIDTLMKSLRPAQGKLVKLVEEQLMAAVGTKVEFRLNVEGQRVSPTVIFS